MTLPDSSLVYPAHGAGSLCGKALGKETFSTIGEQRRVNYALQPMTKAAFVELVTADQPDAPAYFTYDAVLNSKERPTLDEALSRELTPLALDEVLALQASGAQVLDTREPGEFASAHLAGSVNIALGGQYATWAGTVLSHERPIVIVADPGAENESALRLGRIGFDHVAGYLKDGMASLRDRPDLTVVDRAPERAGRRRAAEREGSTDRRGRAHAGRARREAHRGQRAHPAQSARAAMARAADRTAAARLLRGRLSIVDRGEPAPAARLHEGQRDGGRDDGVGNGADCPSTPAAGLTAARRYVRAVGDAGDRRARGRIARGKRFFFALVDRIGPRRRVVTADSSRGPSLPRSSWSCLDLIAASYRTRRPAVRWRDAGRRARARRDRRTADLPGSRSRRTSRSSTPTPKDRPMRLSGMFARLSDDAAGRGARTLASSGPTAEIEIARDRVRRGGRGS